MKGIHTGKEEKAEGEKIEKCNKLRKQREERKQKNYERKTINIKKLNYILKEGIVNWAG